VSRASRGEPERGDSGGPAVTTGRRRCAGAVRLALGMRAQCPDVTVLGDPVPAVGSVGPMGGIDVHCNKFAR